MNGSKIKKWLKPMRNALIVALLVLLSGCTKAPLSPEEEKKDYVDKVYNVELANYEFEERLNSFYESEPIDSGELSDLYDGEFPKGSSEPRALRIHWKDARELALAEVELQKDILGWDLAVVSERPMLVLDRDGGDFYRYYEYRVLKDNIEIGAVRIPAYRRTENFSTSEVHNYIGAGNTYTIETTAWSGHIMSRMILDKDTEFYRNIKTDISEYISGNENLLYNVLYRMNNSLGISDKRKPITHSEIRDIAYTTFDKHRGQININGMDKHDKDVLVDAAAQSITVDTSSDMNKIEARMYKAESTAILLETTSPLLINFMHEQLIVHFLSAMQVSVFNMASFTETNTTFRNNLRDIIWKHIETKLHHTSEIQEYLLGMEWNIFKEMDKIQIKPIVEYPNIDKYPKRIHGNSVREFVFTEFVVLEDSVHNSYVEYSTGLEMSGNKKTSLSKTVFGANEQEFSIDERNVFKPGYLEYKNSRFWPEIGSAIGEEFLKALGLENDAFGAGDFIDLLSLGISAIDPYSLAVKLIVDTANYFINKEIDEFQNQVADANDKLDTAIADLEKALTAQGKTLDDSIDMLDEVIVKAQQHDPRDEDYINELYLYRKILQDEISGVGGTFEDIARNAYNLWMVWIVKPFIAYQHPDEWGAITWQYHKGWPFRSTLDLDRYLADKKPNVSNKEVPEDDRDINTVPEALVGKYDNEWKSLDKWLQEGLFNKGGKIYNISDVAILNIYETLAEDMRKVYINNIVFNEVSDKKTGLLHNPSIIKKDEQNKHNINLIIDDFNIEYKISLSEYIGFSR